MKVTVEKVRTATKGEWDRIWSECEYATYFHSREWAEIWQEYSGGNFRPLPFLFKFSDGVHAVFPLTWHNSQQMYVSSPAWTYGGLISLNPIGTEHFMAAIDCAPQKIGKLFIRANPFAGELSSTVLKLWEKDDTHVVYLNDSIDNLFSCWSTNHRSAVKKARVNGLTISVANSLELWREYYAMYEASLVRWGSSVSSRYNWELFETIYKRKSINVKLWLAYCEGKAIAGALCLYAKRHVSYWHGAAYGEFFKMKPMQLMFHEIISQAVDKNFLWFDFNPSGPHEMVKRFKSGFGTKIIPCPWLEIDGYKHPEGLLNNLRMRKRNFERYLYEHNL